MLYVIICDEVWIGNVHYFWDRPILEDPNYEFRIQRTYFNDDPNIDPHFIKAVQDIDKSLFLAPNVFQDPWTHLTHGLDDVSTGAKMIHMISTFCDKWVFLSSHLGANCFQHVFDLSVDKDIYLFDNSDMFYDNASGVGDFVKADFVIT